MTIEEIIDLINDEVQSFRETACSQPTHEVYSMAYRINIIEEFYFLICESSDMWEDEDEVVAVLASLAKRGRFMLELEAWITDFDIVNVTDLGETMDALCDFCEWSNEKEVQG